MGQYQTFIVRFWTDASANTVRGHIQHIGSRRGIYFRDEEKMLQFVREYLVPVAMPAASDAESQSAHGEPQPVPAEGSGTDDR